MSNEIKNYARYFFKSNRRLLILEFIILFVLLPFMAYNQTAMGSGVDIKAESMAVMSMTGGTSIFCAMVSAFVMPIYIYRFIFKRSSCDLYFALPIKRGTLYNVQFVFGALLALIPLYINYLLVVMLLCMYASVDIKAIFVFYLVLLILYLIMFSMVSFLVVKCNNLLDAILIAGGYMVIPVFIILTALSFMNAQGSDFFVSNMNIATEIIDLEWFTSLLSLPATMLYSVIFLAVGVSWFDQVMVILISFYWVLVGCICFYFGRRTFMHRREEEAQQHTTALATYPFLITVFTICMMMLVFSYDIGSQSMVTTMLILFLLYIVMQMFAKRTLHLKLKDFASFIIIFAVTFSFSYLFRATTGFGLLHEVPKLENINYAEVNYHEYQYKEEEITSHAKDLEKINTYKFQKTELEKLCNVQSDIIKQIQQGNVPEYGNEDAWELTIYYNMKNGKIYSRRYNLSQSLSTKTYQQIMHIIQSYDGV